MRLAVIAVLVCLPMLAQVPANLDLFLLIGQSNMAGRGAMGEEERQATPGIWMLTQDLTWKPAVDPMHYDKPDIVGAGLGRPFAQALLKAHPQMQIGLIPAAFGGSSLEEWKPGSRHYSEAVLRTRAALRNGRLRGILWHQGEADSGNEEMAKSYAQRFEAMIQRLRTDFTAPEVPVLVGELGRFYRDRPNGGAKYADLVVEQLKLVSTRVPRTAFVSSEGLMDKGDGTHFDTPALREFGKRYAEAYRKLVAK